jgi:hypothetical protein
MSRSTNNDDDHFKKFRGLLGAPRPRAARVDLLFAEWLLGESITPATKIDPARFSDRIDKTSPDAIFSAADSALLTWRKVFEKTHDEKWDEMMSFPAPTEN